MFQSCILLEQGFPKMVPDNFFQGSAWIHNFFEIPW